MNKRPGEERHPGKARRAMPDNGKPLHRAPGEMETWEIISAYRHAHQLAGLHPNVRLSRELSNFLYRAQQELERRGEWRPECLKAA
jgi:hypothetical protein